MSMRLATAAAHRYSPFENLELDALGAELESDLVRNIADWIAGLQRPAPLSKEFSADTPAKARIAAVAWLQDFQRHEPLDLENIHTTARGGEYVATVTYRSSGTIEPGAWSDEPPTAADPQNDKPPQKLTTAACNAAPAGGLAQFPSPAVQNPVAPKLPRAAPLTLRDAAENQPVA
jgi:hypothetical protein